MILLLQNFANLKILPCILDWVCKVLEIWSFSWYFWSRMTFFVVSFSAFFSRSFTIAGLYIAIPLGYIAIPLIQVLRTLDIPFPIWNIFKKINFLDRIFNKSPLFQSLNCIERSEAGISLKKNWKIILNKIAVDWMIIFINCRSTLWWN